MLEIWISKILGLIVFLLFIYLVLKRYKTILKFLDDFSEEVMNFLKKHEGFVSIIFLAIFFIEQIIIIRVAFSYRNNPDYLQLIIGLAAVIIITTASFQRLILEHINLRMTTLHTKVWSFI